MVKIKNWIRIGSILNGFIAIFSAFIAAGGIALTIWGEQQARTSIPNDYMAFIPTIIRALGVVLSVLAPIIAGMAGVVFALSLISCLLGKVSLKKHQNLPYSRADLRNTTGRILCNGIMALGGLLMLFFLDFRSPVVIGIVFVQLVICILQIREIQSLLILSRYQ